METIIKKCKWCGRRMKARTDVQAIYNLAEHEKSCMFRPVKEKK